MSGGEGSVFGKYFLLKKIASGGMGEIYLAKLKGPVGFEKLLVIKRILQHYLENPEFVDMFFAEARVAAQLSHSNIVQIYEMGETEDSFYIAMEYVHGKSLRHLLDRARARGDQLHPGYVIDIISGLCDGMSYAHNARDMSGEPISVIHRDINPDNVIVSYSGEVKVIDFGIAKSQMQSRRTEAGTIKGKFVYMSPEQSAAKPLDKRSDIFAIGICLYESLTFTNPFMRANILLSLEAVQRQDPPPLGQQFPRLAIFDDVIRKALSKNRDGRYDDCLELRDALQQLKARVPAPPQPLGTYMREVFAEQIELEQRMILETNAASESQVRAMQKELEREHQSGSYGGLRTKTWKSPSPEALPPPPRRSRVPFALLLLGILGSAPVASAFVYYLVVERRLAAVSPPVVAAAPTAGTPTAAVELPPAAGTTTSAPGVVAAEPQRAAGARSVDRRRPTERVHKPVVKPTRGAGSAANPEPQPAVRPEPSASPAEPQPGIQVARVQPAPPPSAPPPPRPPPDVSFGTMQISTVPPVKIFRNDAAVGQTFTLRAATGGLVFGTGANAEIDPFVARVRYRVQDEEITYAVDAEPWAIVRDAGGIGLGRTPLPPRKGEATTVLDLVNPKEKRQLRITIRFTR